MVSHKKTRISKRIVRHFKKRNKTVRLRQHKIIKKTVTWDRKIAVRQEELWELENEKRRPKEALPITTFIRKQYRQVGLNTPHTFSSPISRPRQVTIFNLEDGRVNVPEVLSFLGTSQVEIEKEPEIWDALEALTSGKSTRKFKSGEVVFYRIVPESKSLEQTLDLLKKDKSLAKCKSDVSSKQIARVHPELTLQAPKLKGQRYTCFFPIAFPFLNEFERLSIN
jgi:hypothetical protein